MKIIFLILAFISTLITGITIKAINFSSVKGIFFILGTIIIPLLSLIVSIILIKKVFKEKFIYKGLGLFFFFQAISIAVGLTGKPTNFIDLFSLLFVVISAIGLTLLKYNKDMNSNDVLVNLKKYFFKTGLIIMLIGIVDVLAFAENLDNMFFGFSVCLLPLLYGFFLCIVTDAFIDS